MKLIALFLLSIHIFAFNYQDKSSLAVKNEVRQFLSLRNMQKFYSTKFSSWQMHDQVFYNSKFTLYLATGLVPLDKSLMSKWITFKKGKLLHIKSKDIYMSAYIEGEFQESDLNEIKNELLKFKPKKVSSILFNLISPVQAEECNFLDGRPLSKSNEAMVSQVRSKTENDYLKSNLKTCLMNALDAAMDASITQIQDLGAGIFNFLKNPIKGAQEFWDKSVDVFNNTKNFIANIDDNLNNIYEATMLMPMEAKVSLICNLISSVGVDALTGILLGGAAGLAKGVASFVKKINLVSKLGKSLNLLARLDLPKEKLANLFQKILKSKNSKSLDDMEEMASFNMKNLTLEIASCAL